MKQVEYKSYIINVDVINQGHSYLTGKTQEEATQAALARAIAYGYKDPKIVGVNVQYSGGSCF